ncbi:hypothetical protein B0J11DRAFT_572078 [Dendryphion nanum]|uniref:Secreted protein n=1 Tax=Dendryphion nanum TaxID=256645 RepID=A0A9P9D9X3_9PLEO|nr:hypothetical protein B0J11DRAFT_572078 [Dendryphion nanum]
MRSTFLLAAVAPAAFVAAAPIEASGPPDAPKITAWSSSGSGCPKDSATKFNVGPTLGDSATVSFTGFKGDSSDNCQVHLTLSGGSPGWQVGLKEVTYRGDAYLKAGTSFRTITTSFWSQDAATTSSFESRLTPSGEFKDSFTLQESAPSPAWSKCGSGSGIFNVNHRPVITGNYGTYNIKSAQWRLEWRQC